MEIEKDSRIYVAAPANLATGGPELLHQLVFELRKLNLDACMVYYNAKESENPVHENYVFYNNPYVLELDDKKENILIVPEVRTGILFDFVNLKKVIWWLSVDNYLRRARPASMPGSLLLLISRFILRKKYFNFSIHGGMDILHFVQSEYAQDFLLKNRINREKIFYLSDYLNTYFIDQQMGRVNSRKKDIVVYNPSKGYRFTSKLIRLANKIEFVPLVNMTKEQVAGLLSQAKVYIDFGGHPGKDRIPREACISGACIITNKSGSAFFYNDVPIPDEYKFEGKESDLGDIVSKINECFSDYNNKVKDFGYYRSRILGEHDVFVSDVSTLFQDAPDADNT